MFLSLRNSPATIFGNIEGHLNNFVESCFLGVDSTKAESPEGVEALLSVKALDEELGKQVIARQEARIRFLNIPRTYWVAVIEEQKYVANWDNLDELLIEVGDFQPLEPVFRSDATISALATQQQEISEELFGFLVGFDGMSLENYKKLISPSLGNLTELPSLIEPAKKLHLIYSRMIGLHDESFEWLKGQHFLRTELLKAEIETFEQNVEKWDFDEEEVQRLFKSTISIETKGRILTEAGYVDCADDAEMITAIAEILIDESTNIEIIDESLVEEVIGNSAVEVAVMIVNRILPVWPEDQVMACFEGMRDPFCKLAEHGKMPLLPIAPENEHLAKLLKNRGMISKSVIEKKGIRIYPKTSVT